jgi:hypothetical protein
MHLLIRGRTLLSKRLLDEANLARREIREGRFQRTMAIITGFSAIVSGFEAYVQHQRGAFAHWLMWTPVWLTPPMVIVAGAAVLSKRAAHIFLPVVSLVSLADGVIGFVYHLRGVQRMPGGFKLGQYNIVMGPPIFAPLLTCCTGVLGLVAALLRREQRDPRRAALAALADAVLPRRRSRSFLQRLAARIAQGRFQRIMALTSAFFAILAGGEAYFEHLRGSYNQRLMWTPIWVTPLMIAAAIGAACSARIAHTVLPLASVVTFLDGLLGFLLHLRGIQRMPGGLSNLRFNITLGPPMFAPLLFSAVGLLGVIASLLRRREG